MRQIFEVYKEQPKRQLQTYSSTKSLKKSSSKGNLKRQSSSPYLTLDSRSRLNRSVSPKRKNKSIDIFCLKSSSSGINIRSKMGTTFQSLKQTGTSTADKFIKRKEKENSAAFLKKKKMAYNYLRP